MYMALGELIVPEACNCYKTAFITLKQCVHLEVCYTDRKETFFLYSLIQRVPLSDLKVLRFVKLRLKLRPFTDEM